MLLWWFKTIIQFKSKEFFSLKINQQPLVLFTQSVIEMFGGTLKEQVKDVWGADVRWRDGFGKHWKHFIFKKILTQKSTSFFTGNHILLYCWSYQLVTDNCLRILLNIIPHILHRDDGTLIAGGKKQVVLQPTQERRQNGDSRHRCGRFVLICLLLQQFGGGSVCSFRRSQRADEYSKAFEFKNRNKDSWLKIQCIFRFTPLHSHHVISSYPQSIIQSPGSVSSSRHSISVSLLSPLEQPSHFTLICYL